MYWFVLIELSVASLTEIQNARGIMDVLTEMLSALEPGNKEVRYAQFGVSNYDVSKKILHETRGLYQWEALILLKYVTFHVWPLLLYLGASAGSYCWFGGAMSNIQAESGTPC